MPFFFVVFHHRARRYFLGAFAVPPLFLGGFFDMLVHALFFLSNAPNVLFTWHCVSPWCGVSGRPRPRPRQIRLRGRGRGRGRLTLIVLHFAPQWPVSWL